MKFFLLLSLLSGFYLWGPVACPPGTKAVRTQLIRIASETNSRFFQSTLKAPSIADADINTLVRQWNGRGIDGLSWTLASHDRDKGFWNMGAQWWNVAVEREYAEFEAEVQALQAVEDWGDLTSNFLHSSMAPWDEPGKVTNQDWFNDSHWTILLNNVRLMAGIAREVGFTGVLLDIEQYHHHGGEPWYQPFNYVQYALKGYLSAGENRPFSRSDVALKIKQRGVQYITAVQAAFPGLALWIIPALHRPPVGELLEEEAMYPYFIDGLIEGKAPSTRLIFGSEATYSLTSWDAFQMVRDETYSQFVERAEAPDVLRTIWDFAPGVYTEIPDPVGGKTDQTGPQRSPYEHEQAVRYALHSGGSYAWIYGEATHFLEPIPSEELLPYLEANIRARCVAETESFWSALVKAFRSWFSGNE